MVLSEVVVDIVGPEQEARFQEWMQAHHYLGALPKIGHTLWYVAHRHGAWLALAVFSAAALKCGARDRWVGWDFRTQYGRLHLVANNTRLLVLPGPRRRNLGSRVLGLCARRIVRDWPARFGHRLVLLETFVDPSRFVGTVYRAANWRLVGHTRGFRRRGDGYDEASTPKHVFVYPLVRNVHRLLSGAILAPDLHKGVPKTMLSATEMRSLPECFTDIDDPRTRAGRRHSLSCILALASAATLCGARGYKAIGEWVDALGHKALERFGVRRRNGVRSPPCRSTIRNLLIRVDPEQLDRALQRWHHQHGGHDSALAIDGKTLRNAIDNDGTQAHVMSVVGHRTKATYTQKKSASSPAPTTKPNAPTRSAPSSRCSTNSTPSPAKPSPPTLC